MDHNQLLSFEYCFVKERREKHRQSKVSEIQSQRQGNTTRLKAAVIRTHQPRSPFLEWRAGRNQAKNVTTRLTATVA